MFESRPYNAVLWPVDGEMELLRGHAVIVGGSPRCQRVAD